MRMRDVVPNTAKALLLPALVAVGLAACDRSGTDGRVEASGTIEATDANLASQVAGAILAIVPEEGTSMDSGEVVAQIDHADLDWQLGQAQAALGVARANLALAVNGSRREDIEQAAASVRQVAAQRDAARDDFERIRPLAEAGTATRKQLDDAKTRFDAANAAVDVAQAALDRLRAGTRPEQIDAARAQVSQAEAAVGSIRQRIAESTVRAPFRGVVTQRLMEPGEMATPGSALVTLTELNPLHLRVYLSEVEVGKIRLGEPVQVFLDARPTQPFIGRVSYISPTAEFTPKNVQTKQERVKLVFAVKVELDNASGLLKPGLPADAVFTPEAGNGRGD